MMHEVNIILSDNKGKECSIGYVQMAFLPDKQDRIWIRNYIGNSERKRYKVIRKEFSIVLTSSDSHSHINLIVEEDTNV